MDNLIRAIYLLYSYNPKQYIHQIRFLNKEVEIIYINDTKTCCFFQEIGDINNFYKKLASQLDSIININNINKTPNKNNKILNVKYEEFYSFSYKYAVFNF
jgi:hypothetical protein